MGMTLTEIMTMCGAIVGGIAGLVLLLVNLEKLKNYFNRILVWKMRRFAQRQQPYCSTICPAPIAMEKIFGKLDQMFDFIEITREISLENHGMALIDRCNKFIDKGFMPQYEKDNLIHSFIPYVIGDGNGKVFNYVTMAMNLPTEEGGRTCEVDVDEIIKREIEKYNKRKELLKKAKSA
jgi:hypothetical protein